MRGGSSSGGQSADGGGGSSGGGNSGNGSGGNTGTNANAGNGTNGSSGDAGGVVVSAPKADLTEAFLACAWAEACLEREKANVHDGAQPAPEPTMSRCMANYLAQVLKGVSAVGVDPRPFDVLGGCGHVAKGCDDYKQCLYELGVLNFCDGGTQPGTACDGDILRLPCAMSKGISRAVDCTASGRRCENGACVGAACTWGDPATCAEDGRFIRSCGPDNKELNLDCHGQECAMFAGQARCIPGTVEACATSASSCEGTERLLCGMPNASRLDCADLGMVCNNGSCETPSPTCDEFHKDTCTGSILTVCASGLEKGFDCADIGATCGALKNGEPGCVVD